MTFFVLMILGFGAALTVAIREFWRASDALQAERDARARHAAELESAWQDHADLEPIEITWSDFREAGWSDGRTRVFVAEHFAGRDRIRCGELRPLLGDVLVRDVLRYRSLRRAAADRYEPIRHTWINVEDLERDGRLPPELKPLVVERERQSGRLIRAGDLLPFVGRPIVRELLEAKLADAGVAAQAG
jgi:hypothetical protein